MATSIAKQAILATTEKGLNKLLQMDPIAHKQLIHLQGKLIAIQSTIPTYTLFIIANEQGLYLSSENDIEPDAKMTAPLHLLLQLLLSKNKHTLLTHNNFILEGESAIIYTLCKLLDELNPDWQHELSQWINPSAADFIVQSVKTGNDQLQAGINLAQQQLVTLFGKVTTTHKHNKNIFTPITDLLDSLQKKFGQP